MFCLLFNPPHCLAVPTVRIVSDFTLLGPFLKGERPAGVRVLFDPPPPVRRGFDSAVNVAMVEVKVSVDLGQVSAAAVAAWLVRRLRRVGGEHRVQLNAKQLSLHDPGAEKLITEEVQRE